MALGSSADAGLATVPNAAAAAATAASVAMVLRIGWLLSCFMDGAIISCAGRPHSHPQVWSRPPSPGRSQTTRAPARAGALERACDGAVGLQVDDLQAAAVDRVVHPVLALVDAVALDGRALASGQELRVVVGARVGALTALV